MAVAIQGNGEELWNDLKEQGGFVPWIAAIGILWAIWEYTPPPYDRATHMLIGVAITGLLIANINGVKMDVTNIFNMVKQLGQTATKAPAKGG